MGFRATLQGNGRAFLTVGSLVLALLLSLFGCVRTGALSGDVVVRNAVGDVSRGTRMSVYLVLPTEVFERDWSDAVASFREEVAPAVTAQKAAERQSDEARLAWDRALASRGKAGAQRGRWTLTIRESAGAGSQERWRSLRATESAVFQARKRVWDIVRTHEAKAHALVEKHAAQRVQTDETGHYILVKVPTGKVYVYARLQGRKEDFVWFLPFEIETSTQRADLTQDNQRRWAFVP